MNEIQGIVSFVAKGFVWFIVIAAALVLAVVLIHVFKIIEIGNNYLMAEVVVCLLSVGVLYVFVPWLRR